MKKAFENIPKVAYVFGDMSGGGHNLQAYKTILYSGEKDRCIAIMLSKGNDCQLLDLLKDAGIQVYYIPFKISCLIKCIRELREIVYENKCSIVHSNGLKSDTVCCYTFKNTSIKHVITLHNYLKEDAFLRMSKIKAIVAVLLQRMVLKTSEYIIACSETLKKQMLHDDSKLKITSIQNGVDIDHFKKCDKEKLRKIYGISEDKLIFISTGRMTPRKRICETAEAFLQANLGKECELWFVGDGEFFEEYKNKFLAYKQIRFWGRRGDIVELLNMADIFVSSSETEGLPLAVLEAIGTGKKVYLSDIPQHKEILEQCRRAGKLYTLGNVDELAILFQQAYKYVKEEDIVSLVGTNFDISVMGNKYKEYYIELDKK